MQEEVQRLAQQQPEVKFKPCKIIHDISGKANSYETTIRFRNSDQEITLILPKNPPEQEHDGPIYRLLKLRYGDENNLIRNISQDKEKVFKETYDDFIRFVSAVVEDKECDPDSAISI